MPSLVLHVGFGGVDVSRVALPSEDLLVLGVHVELAELLDIRCSQITARVVGPSSVEKILGGGRWMSATFKEGSLLV